MTKKQFETQILKLIKPAEMSIAEYKLNCAINGVNASLDDEIFVQWFINEAYSVFDMKLYDTARQLILKGLKLHLLLDFSKHDNCVFMQSVAVDSMMKNRIAAIDLFEVLLEQYRQTEIGEFADRMNRTFAYVA